MSWSRRLGGLSASMKVLLGLSLLVFALQAGENAFPRLGWSLVGRFGLIPALVLRWPSPQWWRLVTYLFLHGGLWHLVFNLFGLLMFGGPVVAQWGDREFLKFFFLCGLGAAASQLILSPHSLIPTIGLSGSVYGLLVAFAMMYPDAVVYVYFLIPMRAIHMAILFGVLEFYAGAAHTTPGIARFAHFGGMITGYLYIRWWWALKIRVKSFFAGLSERGAVTLPCGGPRSLEKIK